MKEFGIPAVESAGDTFILTWPEHDIRMRLNRIVERSETVSAEVKVTKGQGHLYSARVNLLSPQAKRTLAEEMRGRLDCVDWRIIIEQAFNKALDAYREGQPVIIVGNLPKRETPRYRCSRLGYESPLREDLDLLQPLPACHALRREDDRHGRQRKDSHQVPLR